MKDYTSSKIPRLFELMEERNIKAKDIVQATGISQSSFTDWRKGNMPSPEKLRTLADFFNVSIEYLTGSEMEYNSIELSIQAEVRQLSDQEKADVLKYIKFLQSSKPAGTI